MSTKRFKVFTNKIDDYFIDQWQDSFGPSLNSVFFNLNKTYDISMDQFVEYVKYGFDDHPESYLNVRLISLIFDDTAFGRELSHKFALKFPDIYFKLFTNVVKEIGQNKMILQRAIDLIHLDMNSPHIDKEKYLFYLIKNSHKDFYNNFDPDKSTTHSSDLRRKLMSIDLILKSDNLLNDILSLGNYGKLLIQRLILYRLTEKVSRLSNSSFNAFVGIPNTIVNTIIDDFDIITVLGIDKIFTWDSTRYESVISVIETLKNIESDKLSGLISSDKFKKQLKTLKLKSVNGYRYMIYAITNVLGIDFLQKNGFPDIIDLVYKSITHVMDTYDSTSGVNLFGYLSDNDQTKIYQKFKKKFDGLTERTLDDFYINSEINVDIKIGMGMPTSFSTTFGWSDIENMIYDSNYNSLFEKYLDAGGPEDLWDISYEWEYHMDNGYIGYHFDDINSNNLNKIKSLMPEVKNIEDALIGDDEYSEISRAIIIALEDSQRNADVSVAISRISDTLDELFPNGYELVKGGVNVTTNLLNYMSADDISKEYSRYGMADPAQTYLDTVVGNRGKIHFEPNSWYYNINGTISKDDFNDNLSERLSDIEF